MAAIELFNMYAIDTPCERDIFRTAKPINFKFGLWCHTTLMTDAIDLGHVRKLRWPPLNFLIYAIDTTCERDILWTA